MKKIFLPINLHSEYRNVLDYGMSIARRSGARLDIYFADNSWFKSGQFVFGEDAADNFFKQLAPKDENNVRAVLDLLANQQINYRFVYAHAGALKGIAAQTQAETYDLMVLGTRDKQNKGVIRGPFVNQVLNKVHLPTFVVPETLPYNDIQHITYAADLADYDEQIISQIIGIAQVFDAKLSLVHVHNGEAAASADYLQVLEKTVAATLKYPKILYSFLDNTDIFSGIANFVENSNTQLLAMINRKPFERSKNASFTERAIKDLGVPLLAFRKGN